MKIKCYRLLWIILLFFSFFSLPAAHSYTPGWKGVYRRISGINRNLSQYNLIFSDDMVAADEKDDEEERQGSSLSAEKTIPKCHPVSLSQSVLCIYEDTELWSTPQKMIYNFLLKRSSSEYDEELIAERQEN